MERRQRDDRNRGCKRWKDANATIGTAVTKTERRQRDDRNRGCKRWKDANATIGTAVANDGKTPTRRSEPRLQRRKDAADLADHVDAPRGLGNSRRPGEPALDQIVGRLDLGAGNDVALRIAVAAQQPD